MSSGLHRKGYRVPSPALERELRTLLGKNEGSLWRADDTTIREIREADPKGFLGFMERHRKEVELSATTWRNHLHEERQAKVKPPRRLPTLQEREADAAVEARTAAKVAADKVESDREATKRAEAKARGEQ